MMLVVGATGQVGGAAVAELVKLRASVRALVRSNDKGRDLAQPDVELCVGDLEDIHSLVAALRGFESVLLVSAIDPRQVELQGNLVATARRSGVAHIVKLSGLATARLHGPKRSLARRDGGGDRRLGDGLHVFWTEAALADRQGLSDRNWHPIPEGESTC